MIWIKRIIKSYLIYNNNSKPGIKFQIILPS